MFVGIQTIFCCCAGRVWYAEEEEPDVCEIQTAPAPGWPCCLYDAGKWLCTGAGEGEGDSEGVRLPLEYPPGEGSP
jgi:hypothetical protein